MNTFSKSTYLLIIHTREKICPYCMQWVKSEGSKEKHCPCVGQWCNFKIHHTTASATLIPPDSVSLCRVRMESPVPEVSRVCLARREMKDPEDSPDLQVQLVCRCGLQWNIFMLIVNIEGGSIIKPSLSTLRRACLVPPARKVKLETLVKW